MKQLTVYEMKNEKQRNWNNLLPTKWRMRNEANETTYCLRNEEWWETKQFKQLTNYEMKGEKWSKWNNLLPI